MIAGWPWFADWGRDTLLSIPGLLLVDGRTDEAEAMLETWGATVWMVGFPIALDEDEGRISVRRMRLFGICTWLVFGSKPPISHLPTAPLPRPADRSWKPGLMEPLREPLSTATDWWWPKNRAA